MVAAVVEELSTGTVLEGADDVVEGSSVVVVGTGVVVVVVLLLLVVTGEVEVEEDKVVGAAVDCEVVVV